MELEKDRKNENENENEKKLGYFIGFTDIVIGKNGFCDALSLEIKLRLTDLSNIYQTSLLEANGLG